MLQCIMLFAPACLATLIYERVSKNSLTWPHRASRAFCFSLVINALLYAALWLRGHGVIDWSSSGSVLSVSFCVKYMGLSLVFAGLLAVLSAGLDAVTLKAGKKNG